MTLKGLGGFLRAAGSAIAFSFAARVTRAVGTSAAAREDLRAGATARARARAEVLPPAEELERRVAERTAGLVAANEELEAFAYSVSHDLKAPLRSVDGFARILLEEHAAELPPRARRYLGQVREGTQRMGALVDGLLRFSRLSREPLALARLAPAAVARQALAELGPEREGRQVEVAIGDLPECRAAPVLLRQVYVNLLSNALKFTRGRRGARIEVGSLTERGETVYFVRDNGAGFEMQYAPMIFDAFQRLERREDYEGTGIGLTLVQRIVRRHGGRVWAESEPGAGATLYFTLRGPEDDGHNTG
ncbi:MAG: ATP-binding protein [Dehalococcoidia bacterium]